MSFIPEAARSKLKESPTDIKRQKYRELRTKAKTLIRVYGRAVKFILAHLTQISRSSLIAFGPFLSSRAKRGLSMKRWARAMTITRALKHQRLSRSQSYLTPTLWRFSLLPQRCALWLTSLHPTLNELEIPVEMVLTFLKQLDINKATGSDGIPVWLL